MACNRQMKYYSTRMDVNCGQHTHRHIVCKNLQSIEGGRLNQKKKKKKIKDAVYNCLRAKQSDRTEIKDIMLRGIFYILISLLVWRKVGINLVRIMLDKYRIDNSNKGIVSEDV